MRKLLLATAVACSLVPAMNAETIVDADVNFENGFQGWAPDEVKANNLKVENGVLVINNAAEIANWWELQYVAVPEFATEKTNYTVTVNMKASADGEIHYKLGDWSGGNDGTFAVSKSDAFKDVVFSFDYNYEVNGALCEKAWVLFQSGNYVGTYEIKSIKVTHEGEPAVGLEPSGDTVAEWYTGNGKTFGGWGGGSEISSVEEDGKPCCKFVHAEANANDWDAQLGLDVALQNGKYTMTFEVKGDAATGLGAAVQNSTTYAGRGNFTTFDVTSEWKPVSIQVEVTGSTDEDPANRITFNLGKYVGTLYMTNVKLFAGEGVSVGEVAVEEGVVVYNLQGVCVLRGNDASALDALPRGLYIVNGKKTILR